MPQNAPFLCQSQWDPTQNRGPHMSMSLVIVSPFAACVLCVFWSIARKIRFVGFAT